MEYSEHTGTYFPLWGRQNIRGHLGRDMYNNAETRAALSKPDASVIEILDRDSRGMDFLKEGLLLLSARHPKWTFVTNDLDSYSNNPSSYRPESEKVRIYDGKEELGQVWSGWRADAYCYEIANHRLKDKISRGSSIRTTDTKRLLKEVGKMFHRKHTGEIMLADRNELAAIINSASSHGDCISNAAYDLLVEHLKPYILDNFKDLYPIADMASGGAMKAKAQGAYESSIERRARENVDRLPELLEEQTGVNELLKNWNGGSGYLVSIKNGCEYAVVGLGDSIDNKDFSDWAVTTYSQDGLPEHMRRSIGMLKLLENKGFLCGYGARLREDSFYVVQEANDE